MKRSERAAWALAGFLGGALLVMIGTAQRPEPSALLETRELRVVGPSGKVVVWAGADSHGMGFLRFNAGVWLQMRDEVRYLESEREMLLQQKPGKDVNADIRARRLGDIRSQLDTLNLLLKGEMLY